MDLTASERQSFDELVVHTPWRTARWQLPWSFSTFDYRELCALLWERTGEAEFETATVTGRHGDTVHTDRGELRAPLIVDALGWRRVLSNAHRDPAARTRGSRAASRCTRPARGARHGAVDRPEVHPRGLLVELPRRATRCASASARSGPRTTSRSRRCASPATSGCPPQGYQGNWIPHQLRRAAEDGVFFAGDSAGHCLPLTAEGIRTALYFGLACGRELRAVVTGHRSREQALHGYGAFSDAHERKFRWLLNTQRAIGQVTPSRAMTHLVRAFESRRLARWAFDQYLAIAPPSYVGAGPRRAGRLAGRAMASPVAGARA